MGTNEMLQNAATGIRTSSAPDRGEAAGVRRLNINLPTSIANDLETLAQKSGRSMTEVVRNALGLVKIANDAADSNQKLVITDAKGKPVREIVLPK
jgi:hypothetical protein